MDNKEKNPNLLHYAGLVLVVVGWWQLLQLNLCGFGTILLGCGVGLLGCEYEDVKNRPSSNE